MDKLPQITDPDEMAEEIASHWHVSGFAGRTLCTNTEADARGHAVAASVLTPYPFRVAFGDGPPVAVAVDGELYDHLFAIPDPDVVDVDGYRQPGQL